MRLVVVNHVSLDGVMQGPGRPGEDTRDGFRHSGWAASRGGDPALGAAMGKQLGEGFSWLLGHRTYDDLLGHWNRVGGPFRDGLNRTRKYVASSDPDARLPWPNSTLLTGDVAAQVAVLRRQPGGNLAVMGSGHLFRSLLPYGLVDELTLMIHPVALGSGHRLFGATDGLREFGLVECTSTRNGVLVATYERQADSSDGIGSACTTTSDVTARVRQT